jgi:hypothetical protein
METGLFHHRPAATGQERTFGNGTTINGTTIRAGQIFPENGKSCGFLVGGKAYVLTCRV